MFRGIGRFVFLFFFFEEKEEERERERNYIIISYLNGNCKKVEYDS